MVSRLNPYLGFRGEAREAMTFYQQVFGGTLDISDYGDFGSPPDPATKDLVMHSQLETDLGFTLMAADSPPGTDRPDSSYVTLSLSGDDGDALRGYWDKLAAGGKVTMPLEKQMWGDEFGQLTDRFGVAWMVNIAGDQG
jgi:PhnB protein